MTKILQGIEESNLMQKYHLNYGHLGYLEFKFWSIDSKEGGEVTDKNDAATRTSIPNTDSIFKDLLIFLKNTLLFDFNPNLDSLLNCV